MLTRLQVSGFKNLVDVDVRFGPFTCIAGLNGVGKSNLFDAITFLSSLAGRTVIDAALSVRGEPGRSGDLRSLFHRVGNTFADRMSLTAEMIVPLDAIDEFGQTAKATITFLRYELELAYRGENAGGAGRIEILKEYLTHIRKGEAQKHLQFPHSASRWRRLAVSGHRTGHRTADFISTETGEAGTLIKVHQDGGSRGRPQSYPASTLPRTVLSAANNAAESPTLVVARREMQSWRRLQLEPSALRQPSSFTDPSNLGPDGSHLASTLYHLARTGVLGRERDNSSTEAEQDRVYSAVANRLAELIDDVQDVRVDRDDRRQLLTLCVTGRDGTVHQARALSDGTLRFLALSVLELDPVATGVVCLEEPENGIHPARIPAMLDLLREIAVDPNESFEDGNPLRQVIVNTHSPAVVAEVSDDDIIFAELRESVDQRGRRYDGLSFSCLPQTWRQNAHQLPPVDRGAVLRYLNPSGPQFGASSEIAERPTGRRRKRRVADREDLQLSLFEEVV